MNGCYIPLTDEGTSMSTSTEATPAAATNPEPAAPPAGDRECELCSLTSGDPKVIANVSEGGTLPPYYLCVNVPQCDLRVREARDRELQAEAGEPETEAAEESAEVTQ